MELTGDKILDRIVFDAYYYANLEAMEEVITEELLWQELWNGCHVEARVMSGESGQVIWEKSFSEAHAGNGNLAVVRYEGKNCLMCYHNLMYQGTGQLYYKILQIQANGEELNGYLIASGTKVLLNATSERAECYLRSSKFHQKKLIHLNCLKG